MRFRATGIRAGERRGVSFSLSTQSAIRSAEECKQGGPSREPTAQVQPGGTGEQQCKCAKMYFLWDLLRLSVDFFALRLSGFLAVL